MLPLAMLSGELPPFPSGLARLPTPPGFALRLEPTTGTKVRLAFVNRSNRRVRGHDAGFNRAFARRLGGGPILVEPNWGKGLVGQSYAGIVTFEVKPRSTYRDAEVDPAARLRLPKGSYRVWSLAYDWLEGYQVVSNAVTVRVP